MPNRDVPHVLQRSIQPRRECRANCQAKQRQVRALIGPPREGHAV